MDLEKLRLRLAELKAMNDAIVPSEDGFSDEQMKSIDEIDAEFEIVTKQIDAAEKQERRKTQAAASAGRKSAPAPLAKPEVKVGASATDRFHGFKSQGDFLMAVKRAGQVGEIDERLQNVAFEKVGEDGGFLVPEDMRTEILKKLDSQESFMAKTTRITTSGNQITIPVDEKQPWNNGVVPYWIAEGAPYTESKGSIGEASFRLHKMGALVKVTDELLEDAVAMESWIKASAPAAMMAEMNRVILSGNGSGKPIGILNSPFTVTAAKESGQTADTINAKNIINMYSRLFPAARANSAWYINAGAEAQLLGMKDDNDNYIYLAPGSQMNQSPYATLMGRPVIPMMSAMRALGDLGDIMLGDLSFYYTVTKGQSGIKQASSIHLNFDRDTTAFKFTLRVDGKAPFKAPVSLEYGSQTFSSFVILEAR